MLHVKSAEYLNDFKIKVFFSTGEIKIVDLSNHLNGEIFKPLKESAYFKSFYFNNDIGTICWKNGADLAPEFLYSIGQ